MARRENCVRYRWTDIDNLELVGTGALVVDCNAAAGRLRPKAAPTDPARFWNKARSDRSGRTYRESRLDNSTAASGCKRPPPASISLLPLQPLPDNLSSAVASRGTAPLE